MIRWLAIILVTIAAVAFTKSYLFSFFIFCLMYFNGKKIENWIYDTIDNSRKK